jgi:hypothetical protein
MGRGGEGTEREGEGKGGEEGEKGEEGRVIPLVDPPSQKNPTPPLIAATA